MDAKLVTVCLAVTAAACFGGGAFVPNVAAQTSLFALGSFLFGVIGVTRPSDRAHVVRSKAMAKLRERDLVRK